MAGTSDNQEGSFRERGLAGAQEGPVTPHTLDLSTVSLPSDFDLLFVDINQICREGRGQGHPWDSSEGNGVTRSNI